MTEYVYRVVNEDGSFAKPSAQLSSAKGLYTSESRARAAIRVGIGTRVQRATVEWEDVND